MKEQLFKLSRYLRDHSGIALVVFVAVLLELISALQFRHSQQLLDEQLEQYALNELTVKALLVKSILNEAKNTVYDFEWYARMNLNQPDSMFLLTERMVDASDDVVGAFIAFKPNYYPDKGYWFEPCTQRTDSGTLHTFQIGGQSHDYTRSSFYQIGIKGDTATWTDPYIDEDDTGKWVTSFVIPLNDTREQIVGVIGTDLELDWMGKILNERHHFPSSFNVFLTDGGQFIAGPHPDSISPESVKQVTRLINDSTVERYMSRDLRTTIIKFRDTATKRKARVYYANMRGKPHWQVGVVYYDDELYGKHNRMRMRMILLMLVGLALLSVVVYRVFQARRKYQRVEMDKQRIDSELNVARRIQKQMQPQTDNLQRHDLDIGGVLVPAKEVGGDLYDCYIRDEKLFFCIGDVSGKGVPSALLTAVMHTMFQMAAERSNSPAQIMSALNLSACKGNETNMFVTFLLGILDLPTGRLRYCNAGHNPPLMIYPSGNVAPLKVIPNMPLGVIDDFEYQQQETTLHAGEMLFLYTDGLTEAQNTDRRLLGLKAVINTLEALSQPSIEQVLQAARQAVEQHSEGTTQADDLTMLVFRYTPVTDAQLILNDSITIENDIAQVDTINEFINSVASRLNMPKRDTARLKLAVEEAVVNIINYAYPNDEIGTITIDTRADNETLTIVISDTGVAFDPTQVAAADTTLSAEDRPIGGLGILLVRQMMDSINYERIGHKNVLTLKKSIKS